MTTCEEPSAGRLRAAGETQSLQTGAQPSAGSADSPWQVVISGSCS